MPFCRDAKGQVFLVLAHVGQARALISGDSGILAMRDAFPGMIATPDDRSGRQGGGFSL